MNLSPPTTPNLPFYIRYSYLAGQKRLFILFIFVYTWSPIAIGAELSVATAANFSATLTRLIPYFQMASGDTVQISTGSSGKLLSQIVNGAPYDIFLSADAERPVQLTDTGLAFADSIFTYAVGTLALWHPGSSQLPHPDQKFRFVEGAIVALASPRHAPYGRAAQEVLTAMGQWQVLASESRLAYAESTGQAWQFAASGNAQYAFIALSQLKSVVLSEPKEKAQSLRSGPSDYWLPPTGWYRPLVQQGVVLTRTANLAAARRFCHWLNSSPTALKMIQEAGYQTVSVATNNGL